MKKLTIISSILIALIIITSSINIISLNKSFYPKVKDYSEEERLALNNVVNFLNNKEELNISYFNNKEISHMQDVKLIFDIIKIILTISLISATILFAKLLNKSSKNNKKDDQKELSISLKCGSIIAFSFILLLALTFIKFDLFFDIFHNLFFKQGTWLFYKTDMLIRLFPFNFFLQSGIKIIIISIILSSTIFLKGLFLNKSKI